MLAPKTLDEAIALLQQPNMLDLFTRATLVLIAASGGAPAVRAIELLRELPPAPTDDEMTSIPTEQLIEIERRASEYIIQFDRTKSVGEDSA